MAPKKPDTSVSWKTEPTQATSISDNATIHESKGKQTPSYQPLYFANKRSCIGAATAFSLLFCLSSWLFLPLDHESWDLVIAVQSALAGILLFYLLYYRKLYVAVIDLYKIEIRTHIDTIANYTKLIDEITQEHNNLAEGRRDIIQQRKEIAEQRKRDSETMDRSQEGLKKCHEALQDTQVQGMSRALDFYQQRVLDLDLCIKQLETIKEKAGTNVGLVNPAPTPKGTRRPAKKSSTQNGGAEDCMRELKTRKEKAEAMVDKHEKALEITKDPQNSLEMRAHMIGELFRKE